MDNFADELLKMMLHFEVADSSLAFATACAIVGFLAVVLDYSFFVIEGKSLLRLKHGVNTFIFIVPWAVGAFLLGYIGLMVKLFQASMIASCVVGFTWPILFTKLLEKLKDRETASEPEQIVQEEL